MPPAPIAARISYGPRRVPVASATEVVGIIEDAVLLTIRNDKHRSGDLKPAKHNATSRYGSTGRLERPVNSEIPAGRAPSPPQFSPMFMRDFEAVNWLALN